MAYISFRGNSLPLASALLEERTNFGVKVSAHPGIIAKFCAEGKQHFAPRSAQSLRMAQTSINQTVASALNYYLATAGISEIELGKRAGVSPRTVANFLRPGARVVGSRGKEPSGKLTELALIALALKVDVADLVTSMTDAEREQRRRLLLAARILSGVDAGASASVASDMSR